LAATRCATNAASNAVRSCTDPDPVLVSFSSTAWSGSRSAFNFSNAATALSWFFGDTVLRILFSFCASNCRTFLMSCLANSTRRVFKFILHCSKFACTSRISLSFGIGNPYRSNDSASEFTRVPAAVAAFKRSYAAAGMTGANCPTIPVATTNADKALAT
jgi:hypothetical protein